jgi:hypothetical protein
MMRKRFASGAFALMLVASYGGAQSASAGAGRSEVISNGGLINTLIAAPVIGQPYSGQRVQRTIQKLQGGTTISHRGITL